MLMHRSYPLFAMIYYVIKNRAVFVPNFLHQENSLLLDICGFSWFLPHFSNNPRVADDHRFQSCTLHTRLIPLTTMNIYASIVYFFGRWRSEG